jgi:hypothetical protein
MRLSSKLTFLSKILILLIGLPISCVIVAETQYALRSFALAFIMAVFCTWFSFKTTELYKADTALTFKKTFQGEITVDHREINKIKFISTKKHSYLWFDTTKGTFLIIAPMWGTEKDALMKMYETHRKKSGMAEAA